MINLFFNANIQHAYIPRKKRADAVKQSYLPLVEFLLNETIPACFFITGYTTRYLQRNKNLFFIEIFKHYLQTGLTDVEDYTYSHPILTFYPSKRIQAQIEKGKSINRQEWERESKGFLPPEYIWDWNLLAILRKMGYQWVLIKKNQIQPSHTCIYVKDNDLYLLASDYNFKTVVENQLLNQLDMKMALKYIEKCHPEPVILNLDLEILYFHTDESKRMFFRFLREAHKMYGIVPLSVTLMKFPKEYSRSDLKIFPGDLSRWKGWWEAPEQIRERYDSLWKYMQSLKDPNETNRWLESLMDLENSDALESYQDLPITTRKGIFHRSKSRWREMVSHLENLEKSLSIPALRERGAVYEPEEGK